MSCNLVGDYLLSKSELICSTNPSVRLKLCTRKAPDPGKPSNYLMHVSPAGDMEYLSSMYPITGADAGPVPSYVIEYQSVKYRMEIDAGGLVAKISPYADAATSKPVTQSARSTRIRRHIIPQKIGNQLNLF